MKILFKLNLFFRIFFIFWYRQIFFFSYLKGIDENQHATPHNPLYRSIEPITGSKTKKIKKAFNELIQDI